MSVKIMKVEEIAGYVEEIGKASKSLKGKAHIAAVNCLVHVIKSRNTTVINKLCDYMKDTSHGNAVNHWMSTIGAGIVVWDSKLAAFKVHTKNCDKLVEDEAAYKTKVDEICTSKPYYELKKAPKYVPFIIANEVKKLILKAQKKEAEGLDDKDNIEGLDVLVNALKNIDQSLAAEVNA